MLNSVERYFTLGEAISLLPFIQRTFAEAHRELDELRDAIVLYKRMHQVQAEENVRVVTTLQQGLEEVLRLKWQAYENAYYRWLYTLTQQGIHVRDFKKGLIDFPYKARDGHEYCLCWHLGEAGLFYFHEATEGYLGRKPITQLPE